MISQAGNVGTGDFIGGMVRKMRVVYGCATANIEADGGWPWMAT